KKVKEDGPAVAASFFEEAIKADGGYGEAYANLGALRWAEGKKEEAFALFEKAFILSPAVDDIITNYYTVVTGMPGADEGIIDRAIANLLQAVSFYPAKKRLRHILAEFYLRRGLNREALETIEDIFLSFGVDDDTLSAALQIRDILGPKEIPAEILEENKHRNSHGLSVCMIVKNEEKDIVRALLNFRPFADEIILVDTGSADRTKDIARALGARVFDFEWTGDFSAARNFSISQAQGGWILAMDADEVISPRDRKQLRALIEGADNNKTAYSFNTRNYVQSPGLWGWTANDGKYPEQAGTGWVPSVKVRLFANDERIRFRKPVHEMVEASLEEAGIKFLLSGIPIHHYGKLSTDKVKEKGSDYYELGKVKLSEKGADGFEASVELAIQAAELNRFDDSLENWRRVAELRPGYKRAYLGMANALWSLGRYEEAMQAIDKGFASPLERTETSYLYACCQVLSGQAEAAVSMLEKREKSEKSGGAHPMDLLALALACFCTGRKERGKTLAKRAGRFMDAPSAFGLLAKRLIENGRNDYAIAVLEALNEEKAVNPAITAMLAGCVLERAKAGGAEAEPERDRPAIDADNVKQYLRAFLQLKLDLFLKNPSSRLELPIYASPKVSIVLCFAGMAEYGYQCLESLKANADVPYEVIIVDNGSNDQTPLLLDRIDNAVIIRNGENRGFVLACNQGAAAAKGEWLLFLNNDTQIMPGLLSSLIKTTREISGCGAVGGKLILPDGSLQEAGSIIWNDGSCLGYGRGDDPFKPEYCYVKEVDYCSGACLLVKSDIFKQTGMFDERFCPAYYEETDLCMKIRDAGYKVVFQPSALMIHYEFGTGSKNGAMELQTINREKFREKWANELSGHYPPSKENILLARDRSARTKAGILCVEDRVPDPGLGTGYPRSHTVLECLSELGYRPALFPLLFPERLEPCTSRLQQKGIEVIFGEKGKKGKKPDFKAFYAARPDYYDVVWISRPHNMEAIINVIKAINPAQKIIYDAEALFSAREILKLELGGSVISEAEKESMLKKEIGLMDKADAVVTVSGRERETIRKFTGGKKNIRVVGHTYSINSTPSGFDRRRDLLFVGGFLTSPSPNEDAIIHFVRDIYPEVLKSIDARLWIVGTNNAKKVWALASDNVIVTGRVDNLFDYFDKCKVFIVPTRFAAGIPLKLQECLSYGLPAVVSPLIAEQLELDEDTVLVGEGPDDFARKIIRCYTDELLWGRLRANGLAYIKNECAYGLYKERLNDLIGSLTGRDNYKEFCL
ncbi:MAG: glycosyltransferase, partial [Nitrospiraceae bacterium]|nr:glycosyltransferase [Nitrospiraceae bacterium]